MKTLAIVLVAALAAAVPATAYAATASTTQGPPQVCDLVDCERIIDVVRCVGDALGGHSCHAEAASAPTPDPEAILACVGTAVQNWIDGVTPEMCTVNAVNVAVASETPDVEKAVRCAQTAVRNVVDGVTPMPCDV
jgi:hypothetical protein